MRGFRIGAAATAVALVAATAGFLTVATPLVAQAHTVQTVGPYSLTFGWMNEPCYTGVQNAVQLFVHTGGPTGQAVSNLDGLQATVSAGGATSSPMALTAAFDPDTGLGNPAEYDAPLVPTIPGDYTFRITGTINGTKIDISAKSADNTFDQAHDPVAIEFPTQPQSNTQLSTSVKNLQTALQAQTSATKKAKDAASSARLIAIVAIVIAVLLGLVGILTGRRKAPAAG